jgi:hypothetical protein
VGHRKAPDGVLRTKARRWFRSRFQSTLRRLLVGLSDKMTVTVKIAKDMALFVEQKEIRGPSGESAYDDPWALSRRDRQGNDAVMCQLPDVL